MWLERVIMPTRQTALARRLLPLLLVIGGKIQSGRTKEENIGHVADPEGVRAVGDDEGAGLPADLDWGSASFPIRASAPGGCGFSRA
jgi:hypothetical protein